MGKVELKMNGSLARLILNDPPLNLFSAEMTEGLRDAVLRLEGKTPRGLLISAEGAHFSAGADVNKFLEWTPEQAEENLGGFIDMVNRLESLPYPTMAAVQGMCLAGGLEFALACDLIWASDTANFGQVETTIGALPFGGGGQRLAARAGLGRAKEIVLGARMYPAAKFEEWGIVNRIVPAADLLSKAERFMSAIAEKGATVALNGSKQILNTWAHAGIGAADAANRKYSPETFKTEDLITGVNSLLHDGPGKAAFSGK